MSGRFAVGASALAWSLMSSALMSSALMSCAPAPLEARFVRSCRGEYVDACRPYTYARILEATFAPSGIAIGEPSATADVHVGFEVCGSMTPALPRVDVSALIGGDGDGSVFSPRLDGGTSARVVPLVSIPPASDPSATSIDATLANPFFADVPANTDITLLFAPVIDGCSGEVFRLPYRTGARPMP